MLLLSVLCLRNFESGFNNNERISKAWGFTSFRFSSDYPDHKKVPLPALSPTMERGTLVSWAKKEGTF